MIKNYLDIEAENASQLQEEKKFKFSSNFVKQHLIARIQRNSVSKFLMRKEWMSEGQNVTFGSKGKCQTFTYMRKHECPCVHEWLKY